MPCAERDHCVVLRRILVTKLVRQVARTGIARPIRRISPVVHGLAAVLEYVPVGIHPRTYIIRIPRVEQLGLEISRVAAGNLRRAPAIDVSRTAYRAVLRQACPGVRYIGMVGAVAALWPLRWARGIVRNGNAVLPRGGVE